uniref:Uncharacterized protein n=1 Tax=Steinernema glaseri TaxID=37863 RepID=A0A1I7YST5_9BILA
MAQFCDFREESRIAESIICSVTLLEPCLNQRQRGEISGKSLDALCFMDIYCSVPLLSDHAESKPDSPVRSGPATSFSH